MTIRIDSNGIPKIVQSWSYVGDRTFRVHLFDGQKLFLDFDDVRDASLKGYVCWDCDADQMAVDHFAEWIYRMVPIKSDISN